MDPQKSDRRKSRSLRSLKSYPSFGFLKTGMKSTHFVPVLDNTILEDCQRGNFETLDRLLQHPSSLEDSGAVYRIIMSLPLDHAYVWKVIEHEKVVSLLLASSMAEAYLKKIFITHRSVAKKILFHPYTEPSYKISNFLWNSQAIDEWVLDDIILKMQDQHDVLNIMQTQVFLDRVRKSEFAAHVYFSRIFLAYPNVATMILQIQNEIGCDLIKVFWTLEDAPLIYEYAYQRTIQTMRDVMAGFIANTIISLSATDSKEALLPILDDHSIIDLLGSSELFNRMPDILKALKEILKKSSKLMERFFGREGDFEEFILIHLFEQWPLLQEIARVYHVPIGDRSRYPKDEEETMRIVCEIILDKLACDSLRSHKSQNSGSEYTLISEGSSENYRLIK